MQIVKAAEPVVSVLMLSLVYKCVLQALTLPPAPRPSLSALSQGEVFHWHLAVPCSYRGWRRGTPSRPGLGCERVQLRAGPRLSVRYQGLPPVQIVSATEVNFAMAGFLAAMLSNFAFVFRNIKSKEAQKDIGASMCPAPEECTLPQLELKMAGWVEVFAGLGGINLYAWMSILGTIILLPVSLLVEGGQLSAGRASLSSPLPLPAAE